MRIVMDNRYVYLEDAPLKLTQYVARETSYLVKGYQFMDSFVSGYWDGRKKLLSVQRDRRVRAPVGLVQEIVDLVVKDGEPHEIVDLRTWPKPYLKFGQVWDRLRPYQQEAVDAATKPRGSLGTIGRGIIKMPPRSGKTFTAASIIARLGVKTLFVVPATTLLYQARNALAEALEVEIGIAGDGEYLERDVTVATVQTLCEWRNGATKADPSRKEYVDLVLGAQLVIFDECHHLTADQWRLVVQDSPAPYKLGLSATAFLDHKNECELGVIWLRASTGDILVDFPVSDLIEMGYLVRPEIRLYTISSPDLTSKRWSHALHKAGILLNKTRNTKIVEVTKELANDGMRIVVISNRIEQVDELCRLFDLVGLPYRRAIGETQQPEREDAVAALVSKHVSVLIGTVFGEGVDIPEVDAVVVAEGGAGIKQTYQRLRCLTPHVGKDRAVVIDFVDLTHSSFARHSVERIAVYRSERAFNIRVAG
jgi:superfamily II DNA or RNA helicase